MLGQALRRFRSDESGAIAPAYAIVIFALVGMAGVGFDYGRLMAMDSELQNAADQSALAAASQLNGTEGAMVRARNAANDYFASSGSAWVNNTRMSNDGKGRPITELSFRFFESYDSANDTFGKEVASDDDAEDAKVVLVTVAGRKAFYALTPLVGALTSGDVTANAVAGLERSTCNVPPMMFCSPSSDFGTEADRGKGIKMHVKQEAAPGNFGLLDMDFAGKGRPNSALGLDETAAGCLSDVIDTDPGNKNPEVPALNTRFDMYSPPPLNCDPATGDYCPADSTRKDWVNVQSYKNVAATDVAGKTCNSTPTGTWTRVGDIDASTRPPNPGFPEDNCFASGTCSGIGDGVWDGATYMTNNHPGVALSTAAPGGTRYEVYEWERADMASRLQPAKMGYASALQPNGKYNIDLYCSYPQPSVGTPVTPSATQKDRRIMTVAAADCSDLNGKGEVKIYRWVDLFLVSPGYTVGSEKYFFTEVIGPAKRPDGSSGFQYYGRNKPVLLR